MKIRYDPEAVADLARIGLHDALSARVTFKIKADVGTTVQRIARNPLSYALIGHDDIRRAVTRAYRYLVYYRVVDQRSIVVLCIRHGAQSPRFPAGG